jgi:L-asparaginase II
VKLSELAVGGATLLCGSSERDCSPARRVLSAAATYPQLLGGTGALSSRLTGITHGRLVVKGGSEGVFIAVNRDALEALALKCLSGSDDAASVALASILRCLGWITSNEANAIFDMISAPVFNAHGQRTGALKCTLPQSAKELLLH